MVLFQTFAAEHLLAGVTTGETIAAETVLAVRTLLFTAVTEQQTTVLAAARTGVAE